LIFLGKKRTRVSGGGKACIRPIKREGEKLPSGGGDTFTVVGKRGKTKLLREKKKEASKGF